MATEMGQARATFAHEALLYAGVDSFVDRLAAFIREGVSAGEPGARRRRDPQDRAAARGA